MEIYTSEFELEEWTVKYKIKSVEETVVGAVVHDGGGSDIDVGDRRSMSISSQVLRNLNAKRRIVAFLANLARDYSIGESYHWGLLRHTLQVYNRFSNTDSSGGFEMSIDVVPAPESSDAEEEEEDGSEDDDHCDSEEEEDEDELEDEDYDDILFDHDNTAEEEEEEEEDEEEDDDDDSDESDYEEEEEEINGVMSKVKPVPKELLEEVLVKEEVVVDEEEECSICCGEMKSGEEVGKMSSCGHKFHYSCVGKWLTSCSGTCPLCRNDVFLR